MISKSAIRSTLRKRRDERVKSLGDYKDLIINQVVPKLIHEMQGRRSVAGYYSINSEFDCVTILKHLHSLGYSVSLPVITSTKVLEFRSWDCAESSLIKSKHNIPVPVPSFPSVTPETMLVPLLGFTSALTRIGYGGGYYDATKSSNPSIQSIGLAFAFQLEDHLPTEPHDQVLDLVVTESQTFRPAPTQSNK